MTTLAPYVGPNPGYGSIGPNFGSTNLDNIPSSGGIAGYTSAISPFSIPNPITRATRYYTTASGGSTIDPPSVANNFNGFNLVAPQGSSINGTQSGNVDPTLTYLAQLYANQFQTPSAASTSGTPVVVVPQGQATGTDTGTAAPAASKFLVFGVVAVLAYLGYRWYKGRNG